MSKSKKALSAFVKQLEELYKDNLSMVAVTGEKVYANTHINIILKQIEGGEIFKLQSLQDGNSDDLWQIELFCSLDELQNISKDCLVPLFTDCRVLYGSKDKIPKISRSDIRSCAVNILTEVLLAVRSAAAYPDLEYTANTLQPLYIEAAAAVSYIYYLENGKYIANLSALKDVVSDREYVVIDLALNWDKLKNDRLNNPEDAFLFLENFCNAKLEKLNTNGQR